VLEVYRQMVAAVPEAEVKGDTMPYTSLNGNMYSSVSKANQIGVRLRAEEREAFLREHGTTLYESIPGYIQKEDVAVPESMFGDPDALAALFRASHAYAASLKPKATKRK
jgi:hypothetical protein